MIVKIEKIGNEIALTFRTPIDRKIPNPRIKAADIFKDDLNKYLQRQYPKETPSFDVNFLGDLNIETVFVLNKGKVSKQYQVILILIKEPAKADTSHK